MDHQFTNLGDRSTDYLTNHYPNPNPPPADDFKSSYDDLIDQYAEPYSRISRHQTFQVQTPPVDEPESRGPSYSLDYKSPYPGGKPDDEVEDPPGAPRSYPPVMKQRELPVDYRSWWQQILPDSWACRLFVITVLVETTIDIAIEGNLLTRLQARDNTGDLKMPVYLSVFALAHVFQFVLAVDAVYARNTLQFICLILFNLLFLIYAIIQIGEIQHSATTSGGVVHISVHVLTNIIPVVISVAEVAYIALGWKIYNEFGWKVYKFLGADRRIKKMYASYQIFLCLVKFDLFFWIGFSVQFLWLVLSKTDWEYYVTWAALPLSVVLLIEGHLAARYENKWMMVTFMSGCMGALVYFIYKTYKLLKYRESDYGQVWHSLTTFSAIAIFLLLITIIFSAIVMQNFGRGLKASIARNKVHTQGKSKQVHGVPMSMNPSRMSIE